jgi:hypothetical protein
MPTPSLLIVPARFKTGKLYSQIPTSGAGDFTVTRNTAARRFDSAGLIESVASGIPRLDYYTSGGTAGCPALLVEPAATNALSYSEEFDNAAWGKSAMTVSTGTTALFTAPDGTTNADKIIATSGNVAHNINRSGIASAAYTFSVFAKAGEESVISLWLRGASVRAEFNLVSGTVSNITTTSARIENYGNGWYRCTVYDSTAGTTAHVYGRGGAAYAGNGSDGFYLWGAQLETGSIATSYIPTTTGSATRNADVINLSGAVSGCIGQTEGTIYWEGSLGQIDKIFFSIGASTTQTIRLETRSDGLMQFSVVSGSNQCAIFTSGAITIGQFYKVAGAYKQDDFVFYVNGVQVGFDNSGTIPTALAQMQFSSSATANLSIQRCRALALYTTRLTNAQLAALTTL